MSRKPICFLPPLFLLLCSASHAFGQYADFHVNVVPYTSPTRSTCGAGDDCCPAHAPSPSEDHTYRVKIPYASDWVFSTCLTQSGFDTWMAVGSSLCEEDVGYNDDACGSSSSELIAYLEAGYYYVDIEGNDSCGEYVFEMRELNPPSGACCVAGECVATNELMECTDDLGGLWFRDEACPGFQCPQACGQDTLYIYIRTDALPAETSWELYDEQGGVVASDGPLQTLDYEHAWQVCLSASQCYEFHIYDSSGDGLNPGYWALFLNGVLAAKNDEFESSFNIAPVGNGCAEVTGACCVDGVCVATTTELDCPDLGGRWYQDEDCFGQPPFECEFPTANYKVTAPYTSPLRSTCGAQSGCAPPSHPCQELHPEDHTYEVTIPYDGQWAFRTVDPNLPEPNDPFDTWIAVGWTLCGEEVGWNDNGQYGQGPFSEVVADLEAALYQVVIEGNSCAPYCGDYILEIEEYVPPIVGACCYDGVCTGTYMEIDCYEWCPVGSECAWYEGETCPEFQGCPPPPTGACCFDADCIATSTQVECMENLNGDAWYVYEDCNGSPPFDCPPPIGACCVGEECLTTESRAECASLGGTWYDYVQCAPPPPETPFTCPPLGACCTGSDCVAMNTEGQCWDLQGAWYEGEDCFGTPPFECPGACCVDGSCVADNTYAECSAMNGDWHGGKSCDPLGYFKCPGACCVDDVCTSPSTEIECDDLGGDWYPAETCAEFECPDNCPEDLDDSGSVDLSDLAALLANYGLTGMQPSDGDFDGDGDVDLSDLAQLLSVYSQACPTH